MLFFCVYFVHSPHINFIAEVPTKRGGGGTGRGVQTSLPRTERKTSKKKEITSTAPHHQTKKVSTPATFKKRPFNRQHQPNKGITAPEKKKKNKMMRSKRSNRLLQRKSKKKNYIVVLSFYFITNNTLIKRRSGRNESGNPRQSEEKEPKKKQKKKKNAFFFCFSFFLVFFVVKKCF